MQKDPDFPGAACGQGRPVPVTSMSCQRRALRLLALATAAIVLFPMRASGQSVDDLKAGVVKVVATGPSGNQVGTGIIVRIDGDRAYIATAAHVVKGSTSSVEFFSERNRRFDARLLGVEARVRGADIGDLGDDLAALVVEGRLPAGIRELSFDQAAQASGGDPVKLIGFPREQLEGTAWAVTTGSITGFKDRNLTFQAPVLEGNSGGPLILKDRVVGVVVVKIHEQFGQAVPAETATLVLKTLGVPLRESPVGSSAYLSGTWKNPANAALSYVFTQQGATVTVQELSQEPGGPPIRTAEGTGQIEGRMLTLNVATRFGTAGVSRLTLSDDGTLLSGTYSDLGSGDARLISLSRSSRERPAAGRP
jgi:S1-C subfamily serine protease